MNQKTIDAANKRKFLLLGSILLLAVLLALAATIFFGSNKLLRLGYAVETYFNESVQGVEVGTVVKHRGVSVGVVDEIGFLGDEYANLSSEWGKHIFIRFKIDNEVQLSQEYLQTLIENGLHAKILPQGIGGLSYIELDYIVEGEAVAIATPDWEPKSLYIPSTPGLFSTISSTIQKLSGDLRKADLESAFKNVNKILKDVSIEIQKSHVSATVVNIDGLVTELRRTNRIVYTILQDNEVSIRESVSNLRKVSRNLEELTERAKNYPSYVLFGDPPPRSRSR